MPPADLVIRMWGEVCSTGLWNTEGYPLYPTDLPITVALRERLEQWAAWYTDLDLKMNASDPWESLPNMPTAEYTAFGRELAFALQAELPPERTIFAFDVDSWRFPKYDQGRRCLRLKGTAVDAG